MAEIIISIHHAPVPECRFDSGQLAGFFYPFRRLLQADGRLQTRTGGQEMVSKLGAASDSHEGVRGRESFHEQGCDPAVRARIGHQDPWVAARSKGW